MSTNEPPEQPASSLTRLIGAFYILAGAAGMIVLLFAKRPEGFEVFNEPLVIILMTLVYLALIVIGLLMAVPKRDPKMSFIC